MRFPKAASTPALHEYCRYVGRRLHRSGHDDLHGRIRLVMEALLAASRSVEACGPAIDERMADRDIASDQLQKTADHVRRTLASRGVKAERSKPYTDVLPSGIRPFRTAKVGDEVQLYELLLRRLEVYLPELDPLRTDTVPILRRQIVERVEAESGVDQARAADAFAREARRDAVKALEHAAVSVYGVLLGRVGRDDAARFFPRRRRQTEVEPEPEGVAPLVQ
ncbi:MAG: hypothetical protein ABMB14_04730 [Myxococcota bacterium]